MDRYLVFLLALLQGCATCERHPVVCRAAIAGVAAGIVYAASTHHHLERSNQCANIGLQC